MTIYVKDGSIRIPDSGRFPSCAISGIQADAKIPGILPGHLRLELASAAIRNSAGIEVSVSDASARLDSLHRNIHGKWVCTSSAAAKVQMQALDSVLGHEISAPYRYFPMPKPLSISCISDITLSKEEGDITAIGRLTLSAALNMNAHEVPISLIVPFSLQSLHKPIAITDADAVMEDDRACISGQLYGALDLNPVLEGSASIRHFSLTRWFGFGRLMDPGLQKALDDIKGEFHEFRLSKDGVSVPRLSAEVSGIRLEGSGGCEKFLSPVVRIDAHASNADLHAIFPELSGIIPDMSHLPPPVIPLEGKAGMEAKRGTPRNDDSSINVGYDIHISADTAKALGMVFNGVDVHVVPAPGSGTMLPVKVTGAYGGSASAKVYIRDRIRIAADLRKIGLAGPSAALAGFSALSGTIKKGSVDISFLPGNGAKMLTSLSGKIDAVMANGSIRTKRSSSLPYSEFEIHAKAAPAGPARTVLPKLFPLSGTWNVSLASNAWNASLSSENAVLYFSSSTGLPSLIKDQPARMKLTLRKNFHNAIVKDLPLDIRGNFAFDAEKKRLGFRNTSFSHDAFKGSGTGEISGLDANPELNASIAIQAPFLRNALLPFGFQLPETQNDMYRNAELKTGVRIDSSRLNLSGISLSLDRMRASGSLTKHFSGSRSLSLELTIPRLDADEYLPAPSYSTSPPTKRTPIPVEFLRNESISLKVSVGTLRFISTAVSSASLKAVLKNGVLTAGLTGGFPSGGSCETSLRVAARETGNHADITLKTRALIHDMAAVSRDRKQKNIIGGRGKISADIHSSQSFWEEWSSALGGNASFRVENGYVASSDTPRSKGSSFKLLSFTAEAQKGLVSSQDFKMTDTFTKVSGKGSINLKDMSIDGSARITVAGIPELPFTISGTLFKPETNYKILGAVTGTVGNLGSSIFDLAGGIITLPFKLFTKNTSSEAD